MIDEPLGAFMYRSSIILDLSDSGLFHGQLLTVLGSPSNFHGCQTPRVCLRVGHQDSQFGPSLAHFSDYYLVLGS